jgi:hypothetical protein
MREPSATFQEIRMTRLFLALGVCLIASLGIAQERTAPAANAEVYIIAPLNGATVHGPVTVRFGKGQTETTLALSPGKHTLELVFADYLHQSFDPPLHSKKITITVE